MLDYFLCIKFDSRHKYLYIGKILRFTYLKFVQNVLLLRMSTIRQLLKNIKSPLKKCYCKMCSKV